MTRLEQKCLIASSSLHAFLLLLLVFGSAFFVVKEKPTINPRIHIVPTTMVESALAGGGGNPKIAQNENDIQKGNTLSPLAPTPVPRQPPQPKPPQPAPTPPPKQEPKQEAKVEPQKPAEPPKKATPKPADVVKPPAPDKSEPKYKVDLTDLHPVTPDAKAKAKADAEARQAQERREAQQKADAARKRFAQEFTKAATDMQRGFSGGTKVDIGGPGGEAFASYGALVQAAYEDAWRVGPDLTDDDAIAVVRVTISRNGRVIESQITRRSGKALMDRSVQRALDKVKADGLPPFPDFIKETERTFTIEFNLRTKRLTG